MPNEFPLNKKLSPGKDSQMELPLKEQIFFDIAFIEEGPKNRDGTIIATPVYQKENGAWFIGEKEVTVQNVLLMAGRELPKEIVEKLKKQITKE